MSIQSYQRSWFLNWSVMARKCQKRILLLLKWKSWRKLLPITLPSSSDLIDFQQARTPKLLSKLDAISDVPVDLLPKKEDLSNRIDMINKKLDDQVHEMEDFEQKTVDLQNVVDECRGKLRIRDTPAPIDDVTKDEQDLSAILVAVDSIPQEDLSPRNQLARDVNNIKEQVKGQLATLRKALPDEMKARQQQDELKDRLSSIADALTRVDPENLESAKQQMASIDTELQKLSGVADAYQQFATSPSSVVSHDDLDKTLPEQVQKLKKECDEKKKDIEQIAQLKSVAPEILLISESLQQQPEEIPHNLNDQQSVLEELETKKQRLENLIQTIPVGEATEELRQRSAWDLSRLKDLLKRLGDSVGDKLAALAAFNVARKDAEDQLLMITSPESDDRTPDDLKKDEESLQRLQQSISQLDSSDLDDEQRDEHAQLLDRINRTLAILKQRRSDIEAEIAQRTADEALRDAIAPVTNRLAQLVNDADRLLGDAEGVPAQYRPSAEELSNECKKAVELLRNAPKTHPSVETLETALSSAENMIPVLEERANNWDEFVKVRDEADVELDKLRQPLDEVLAKPRRTINDAKLDFDVISAERQKSHILDGKVRRLQELSELLDPLDSAYADVRFIDVDAEQTVQQYDDVLNDSKFQHYEQLSMLQQKHDEANHGRKHVDPDSSRLSILNDRMGSLDALLRDAKASTEKDEQDRLNERLRIGIFELQSIPLRDLSEKSLDDIEKEIHVLPSENAEPLQKQIDDMRKSKKQHDDDLRQAQEHAIATLPSTRDIETLEANLGRMRDARDSLANVSPDLLAEENIGNRVEDLRKTIDDLSKRDEEELQKMLIDRDTRNNAIESLEQIQREVEELEKALPITLPSSSDLIDFQQARTPKLLSKLDAISDVPVDLLPKKEDLSNRIDMINKKLDDQVHEMEDFEQKTVDLQNVVDECRGKLRIRDTPAPIDDVTKDEQDLSAILVAVDSIPQEDLSPRNQLARDVNNIKEQVKGQLATLRKALPDEMKARQNNKMNSRIAYQAKQQMASIDTELQKLSGVADAYQQFATSPSSVVSHDDLDKTLPEQVQKLKKECDEKKKDIEQIAQLKSVAPEILLISESLQQQPEEIPHNLNDQQSVLEELETKKQRLENLIQTIPVGEATEELRQRSAWDLSRLKDLLKRLGDSVGDKLAALAAFNVARKDAEDQLLMITSPESDDRTPDDLKKDEESLQRLQQSISQLDSSDLDDEQRDEHAQLLDRINRTLAILKQRRSDIEAEIAQRTADEALRDAIAPVTNRLAQLVNDADRLLGDAEGVPAQYRPSAEELSNECKKAVELLRNAPKTHPSVETLETALSSAENMIPVLEERANNWDEFVKVRDEADVELDKLRQPLDEVLAKPRRTINDAKLDFDVISAERQKSHILDGKVRRLQELSELLDPLDSAYADVRFIDVDAEQTVQQYDDVLNELSSEIEDESLLCDSQPTKETIENIEQFQIPALRAQLSMLQQKHDEANHGRKHVDPDSSRLSILNDRMGSLDALLRDAKASTEKDEQDRLNERLRIGIFELQSIPLRDLSEKSLDDIEKEIHVLPSENAEPLQKQIDDMRKSKKQHDDDLRQAQERLAMIEDAIATLPSTRDIETLEANLGRMRDARDSLANVSPDLLAEENIGNRVEDLRKTIDDLSKRDEEELQKMLIDRDTRNNAIESLEQIQREVEELEKALPINVAVFI
ncbi:putative DNA-directed RNA polymerase, omega subunit [Ostertagia ostertagi]